MPLRRYIPEIGNDTKTYATEANAVKAVEKHFAGKDVDLQYMVFPLPNGRYLPIFTGGERAMQQYVHFHFYVVG